MVPATAPTAVDRSQTESMGKSNPGPIVAPLCVRCRTPLSPIERPNFWRCKGCETTWRLRRPQAWKWVDVRRELT
jgi:tRNA(Ile2) C34 agmatinyltransferase TiaS